MKCSLSSEQFPFIIQSAEFWTLRAFTESIILWKISFRIDNRVSNFNSLWKRITYDFYSCISYGGKRFLISRYKTCEQWELSFFEADSLNPVLSWLRVSKSYEYSYNKKYNLKSLCEILNYDFIQSVYISMGTSLNSTISTSS